MSTQGGDAPTGWEEAHRRFASSADDEAADRQDTLIHAGAPGGPGDDPPPGAGGGGDGPNGDDEGPRRCSSCEAVLDEDQTYCLVCGEPTEGAPRLARSLRSPALIGGALAILGIGAAALALVLASDSKDDAAAASPTSGTTATSILPGTTAPGTGPLPPDTTPLPPGTDATAPTPPETSFPTVTTPDPIPEPDPDPIPEPDPPSGRFDWPAGEVAWTAVLSSVRSESDAIAARDHLQATGEEAGVLLSTDHADLRPGYYVVFSGMFAGRADAVARARSLGSEFPGAYAREIS